MITPLAVGFLVTRMFEAAMPSSISWSLEAKDNGEVWLTFLLDINPPRGRRRTIGGTIMRSLLDTREVEFEARLMRDIYRLERSLRQDAEAYAVEV